MRNTITLAHPRGTGSVRYSMREGSQRVTQINRDGKRSVMDRGRAQSAINRLQNAGFKASNKVGAGSGG